MGPRMHQQNNTVACDSRNDKNVNSFKNDLIKVTRYGDVSVPFITISLLFSSAPLGQDSIWAVLRCVTCLTSANRNHCAVAKRGGALIGQFWLLKKGRKGCFSLSEFFCLQPISLLDMRKWSPVCVKPSSWLAVLVFWCKFLPLGRRVAAQCGEWCGFLFLTVWPFEWHTLHYC